VFKLITKVSIKGFPKQYTVGGTLSLLEAVEKIKSGRFMQAVWKKNNGEIVSRNIRHGVQKTLKGGTYTCDPNEYLPVTDMSKYNSGAASKSFVNIKLSTLIGIVVDGQMMLVR
jgi:hypothetical protein